MDAKEACVSILASSLAKRTTSSVDGTGCAALLGCAAGQRDARRDQRRFLRFFGGARVFHGASLDRRDSREVPQAFSSPSLPPSVHRLSLERRESEPGEGGSMSSALRSPLLPDEDRLMAKH